MSKTISIVIIIYYTYSVFTVCKLLYVFAQLSLDLFFQYNDIKFISYK